ncbi:type III PLP-dependent enzyme [Bacillus sp. SCS-153A]|uniref:type III PLP-dependent enzyme n=1 Tax=Rossellomorea sedimentorum TaxID=3115294 RepID=UPI0039062711
MNIVRVNNYLKGLIQTRNEEPLCAYIYDLKRLKEHAKRLRDSLPPYCSLYYAVKANPDKRIIETLSEVVDGYDTASEGEILKVKGLSNLPIIFAAPAKKDREMKYLADGSLHLMNIESERDLHRLNRMGEKADKALPVLIRVNSQQNVSNSSHKMSGVPTQFGIEEKRIPDLLEKLASFPYIKVRGFHFHAMSNNLNAAEHLFFVNSCLEKSIEWKQMFSLDINVVDVGGGIGVNYENPSQSFDWDNFSKGLHRMQDEFEANQLELIMELGRYMTAHCGFYITEVIDLKKNYDEWFALVRGGTHHLRLPAAWKMSHPFSVLQVSEWREEGLPRPGVKEETVTIAGELCTPNDLLVRKQYVDELKVGDIVMFHLAGAYGWTISHHDFLSHPHPKFHYLD